VVAVEAVAAWSQYRRLVIYGELDQSLIQIPTDRDPISLGKIAGWAAAGNELAQGAAAALSGHPKDLVDTLVADLQRMQPGPPVSLLDLAASYPPSDRG
jgi:hypothetical protein